MLLFICRCIYFLQQRDDDATLKQGTTVELHHSPAKEINEVLSNPIKTRSILGCKIKKLPALQMHDSLFEYLIISID